jgi:FlaG/FlaF family flagellin (archaellin)
MMRVVLTGLLAWLFMAGAVLAADKEVTGKVVKVDAEKRTITVQTADGKKVYDVNDDTKFLGPKGGLSEAGIKDDRLARGAEIKLLIAGNNKTVREVHLPERKKDK